MASPEARLQKRFNTLERRIDYLEEKEHQNSWDRAEISALNLALEVLDLHQETAVKVLQGVK